MNRPTDVLEVDPLVARSSAEAPGSRADPCTAADLDMMEAIMDLQVEQVAYRTTLQALEGPLVAGLQRFLG